MSKELETLELTVEAFEITANDIIKLDDLSLALVGGGEVVIAA